MNVDTGALYYGAMEIEAALLRGEDLIPVGPDIADGAQSVRLLARVQEERHDESPLVTVRFGPDSLVAPAPKAYELPAHALAAAMAKRLR